ncbi:cAMP-dependent protein kinase inhibitor beta [Anabarilius grahami]|uniref:cAMP-dependent protein kinase inhibitor beta n=1 Tax=Anabarilius grahami TaxID=495550 RepID=A0A3N0ZB05_ANAGA|nr:cAMP-dependent protein kinase inhibitor beta [Anabarilius grahami]
MLQTTYLLCVPDYLVSCCNLIKSPVIPRLNDVPMCVCVCSNDSNGSGEMTEVEPALDFASSGRSGRRNALPDILGSPAGVNPSDLPLKLAELSLTDGPGGAQSPTSQEAPLPPESTEEKQGS